MILFTLKQSCRSSRCTERQNFTTSKRTFAHVWIHCYKMWFIQRAIQMYMAQNLQNRLFLQYYCFLNTTEIHKWITAFLSWCVISQIKIHQLKRFPHLKVWGFFRDKDVQLVKLFQFCLAMPQIKDLADIHRTLVISESGVLLQPLCLSKLD